MDGLVTLLSNLLAAYWPWIAAAAAAIITLHFSFKALIVWNQRRRDYDLPVVLNKRGKPKSRFSQPRTWLKLQPRDHFAYKAKILSHEGVRDIYVNRERRGGYMQDVKEGQLGWQFKGISPFPRAVAAVGHMDTSMNEPGDRNAPTSQRPQTPLLDIELCCAHPRTRPADDYIATIHTCAHTPHMIHPTAGQLRDIIRCRQRSAATARAISSGFITSHSLHLQEPTQGCLRADTREPGRWHRAS